MTNEKDSKNSNNYPPSYYPDGNYGYPAQSLPDDQPINWKKYLYLFISNWYWFLITIGIAVAIASYRIRYAIPNFQATVSVIIEEDENAQDILGEIKSIRFRRRKADLANETAKLTSYTIVKRAIDSLKQEVFWTAYGRIRIQPLYQNPRFNLEILDKSADWYIGQEWSIDYIDDKKYRFYREEVIDTILPMDSIIDIRDWNFRIGQKLGGSGHDSYSFIVNNPNTLASYYKNKISIETGEDEGTVIKIMTQGPVAQREVDFLNTLAEVYIESGLERKQQIAQNTVNFIDEQIEVILDSLNRSEEQLLTFRLANSVINLSKEGEIAYEKLKTYHSQKTQLKLKDTYYQYLRSYIEARNDPQTIISPTLLNANDELLISAVQELQGLYKDRENLDYTAMIENPALESINDRITSLRMRIVEIVNGLIENNKLVMDQISTEEQAVIDQLKKLPVNEQQLLNIRRKYDLYNSFYTFLLERRAEAGIQKASTISNSRVLDAARSESVQLIGINQRLVLLIAFAIGLFVPALILILRALIDNRIHERQDIINKTDLPIIGVIGHAADIDTALSNTSTNTSFAEALRRIRSNLSFMLHPNDKNVILVTSSISGEGKTFSATNIATIIAMNNKKVLLMGCDLRKPSLHRTFNYSNEAGITSVIMGETSLEDTILSTDIENLSLLLSGSTPPNPAELIETKAMEDIFTKLKKKYDYIIVDTPPIALVSDALSLAKYADMTLYIIRQNYSHKDVLEIINSINEEQRLPRISLLINDIKPSRSLGINYYYGYSRGYNYGYYDYSYSKNYYEES